MIHFLFPFLNHKHVLINLEALDQKSQKGKSSRVGNSLSLNLASRLKNRDLVMTQKAVDQINCPGQGLSRCPSLLIKHINTIGGDCPSIFSAEVTS